jgi:hypothetical protein
LTPIQKIFLTFSGKTMENLPPNPLFHKPLSIVAAKNILYAVLFMEVITWTISRWRPVAYAAPTAQTIITIIVTMVILFVLIKCVTAGMKWARVVLLVLFLLGLFAYAWNFGVLWQTNILIAVLELLQTILEAVALGFLFTRDSTLWFDRVREKAMDEPHK